MDRSELKLKPHTVHDNQVVEVWYKGEFVASVYGTDGPGVRVITKHPYDIVRGGSDVTVNVIEVKIELKKRGA